MSDDLISRRDAIDAIREAENRAFNGFYKGLVKAHKIIAELPSAQPKKGRWVLHTYMPHVAYCTICERNSPYNRRWDFCPNCGADMRGEQNGQ